MPIRNYPFSPIGQDPTPRPMLWIRVINPKLNLSVRVLALVDTGADDCLFPAQVATELGHDLESVEPKVIVTANGPTNAYPHTSKLEILEIKADGKPGSQVLYTIPDTLIDFTQGCECFLLGTKTFLNRFVLTIDYPKQVFSILNPSQE